MAYLHIEQSLVNEETVRQVQETCPFDAFTYRSGWLSINAACKMCRLCLQNGPPGLVTLQEGAGAQIDKGLWRGIAVYAEQRQGEIHDVALELLGKARELAQVNKEPVYALLIGSQLTAAKKLLHCYGADKVFVYDYPELEEFRIDNYCNAFYDFISKARPNVVMVGATQSGRALAPRLAARCRSGLTADCTKLEMKENGDLVQIRPAFGGNIMAQIITPNHRPQFCTVRYKVFSAPPRAPQPTAEIIEMLLAPQQLQSKITILSRRSKPREVDIAEAEILVAMGRGFRKKEDLQLGEELARQLGGMTACTRPLIEAGWFDARRQIGLSGRTVKPKLLIAAGISGAVQFSAGMRNSDFIIAINPDAAAPIFDIAHIGLEGDLYEILPILLRVLCQQPGDFRSTQLA